MPDAPAPSSDEKALADKLMEELKASGVDVEALQKAEGITPTASPAPPVTPAPAPATPSPPATPPPALSPSEASAKLGPTPPKPPKKKFSLPHLPKPTIKLPFGKKDASATPAAPVIPNDETTQITQEALVTMIDDKLKKIGGDDFITIKISKSGMLLLIGLLLLIIWLLPIVTHSLRSTDLSHFKFPFTTTTTTSTTPKIRIRLNSDSLDAAQTIEKLVKQAGFTNIETIKDTSIASTAAQIVTKKGQTDLNQKLTSALASVYLLSTDSAELTTDSDFDATILIGPHAPKSTQ